MTTLQPQPTVQSSPAPYTGPASYDSVIAQLNGLGEGVWINTSYAKIGSIEVTGVFSALSVNILGSNSLTSPPNAQTITVGGTVTTSDPITLTFANPNLAAGTENVVYTTIGGDTTTTIATALAAAINADVSLFALGIVATSALGVVTINYPNAGPTGQEGPSATQPANQNITIISGTVGGSATETLTIASASTGSPGVVSGTLSMAGLVPVVAMPRWIKAVVGSLTGSSVIVNFHGAA